MMATVVDKRPFIRAFFPTTFVGAKELGFSSLGFWVVNFEDFEAKSCQPFLYLLLFGHVNYGSVLVD